ncbi:IS1595 family transposase [soil metagenome]
MDMNLPDLIERFGSEDRCRGYLEALRWPSGVRCPRCESDKISRIVKRNQYDCDSCRYQFSVRAGTVFHDSHLKLWKWFLAVYLICEAKKGVSANQLKRTLNVSYKTAWYLCHRIRWAMHEANPEPLEGIVEMDETFVGGKAGNMHKSDRARKFPKGSHPHANKTMIVGAVERGGDIRLKVGGGNSAVELHDFIRDNVDGEAMLYTDENRAYKPLPRHESVSHFEGEYVRGDVSTNNVESAWSLFKRSLVGSYHQLSTKHMDAYLDEFEFRFNNRENPYLFRDTLLALLKGDTLTYEELTMEPA